VIDCNDMVVYGPCCDMYLMRWLLPVQWFGMEAAWLFMTFFHQRRATVTLLLWCDTPPALV